MKSDWWFVLSVIILHILPVITGVLGGIYNAFQTAKADISGMNWFWLLKHPAGMKEFLVLGNNYYQPTFREEILTKGSATRLGYTFDANDLWYIGSNDFYSHPGNFVNNKNDAWHRWKMMWIFMLSFIAASSCLLGVFYMWWFLTYGYSIMWLIGFIYIFIQASLQYFFQGASFAWMYCTGLDSRVSKTPSKITKFFCWLVNDYKYPTTVTPVNYAKLTGRE